MGIPVYINKLAKNYKQATLQLQLHLFMFPAPLVFNVTWPLVKPLLTGNTMSKLTFLGCNKGKILAAMQERMPNDSLPTKYRKLVEKK